MRLISSVGEAEGEPREQRANKKDSIRKNARTGTKHRDQELETRTQTDMGNAEKPAGDGRNRKNRKRTKHRTERISPSEIQTARKLPIRNQKLQLNYTTE